jgi:hypothetical protein
VEFADSEEAWERLDVEQPWASVQARHQKIPIVPSITIIGRRVSRDQPELAAKQA